MSALVPGTLVLTPHASFRGYVLHALPIGGYRVYWPSIGLEGVSPHEGLTPVCSPAKLDVMARWHGDRAARVQARRLATATTVPRDVLAVMARKVSP